MDDYSGAKACNLEAFSLYFRTMLEEGIYLPPSQFEANFVSLAHSEDQLERAI
ncbi:hypothetical protein [Halonatronum saccharophilum]|uniref:hypothetical protein n=1 Tax=Halonatronum saccharophilum TaxID=150060 RepID=UPI0004BB186F|nr:hypothetical protein [Halonatronum saccharophilum]